MLRLTHEYRDKKNVKGSSADVNPACVIITSNEPWYLWKGWKDKILDREAFQRRITDEIYLSWNKPSGPGITDDQIHQIRAQDPNDKKRLKTCYVRVAKGNYDFNVIDPPQDAAEGPTDEQVENLVQTTPAPGTWLVDRRKKPRREEAAPPAAAEGNGTQELMEALDYMIGK